MNVSPSQRWKLLGLACIGGLAGYMFLNAAGLDPVPTTQASASQVASRIAPSPQPFPDKAPAGGVVVKVPRPPAPPFSGPGGRQP
jgi:hypothetical protein